MTALFANRDENVLIRVNLVNGYRERLSTWLEEELEHVYDEIDFHEGGGVMLTPEGITFTGDNGHFVLHSVKIKEV